MSSKRLQDVLVKTNIFVLAIRLQDVFKTFSRRLEDVFQKRLQDILKTSLRRLEKISSRYFQDVSLSSTVLVNKSSRRIQLVSKTLCIEAYLQKDLLRSHFWEIYSQCTKFARVIKISQVLVLHFTTSYRGCTFKYLESCRTTTTENTNGFKLLTIDAITDARLGWK